MTYEEIREQCIKEYAVLQKDKLVFDLLKISKETRLRLIQDNVYLAETACLTARSYKEQLIALQELYDEAVDDGQYQIALKAFDNKQKLLFEDIGKNSNDKKVLNIVFDELKQEDYTEDDSVELSVGNGSDEIDFSAVQDQSSMTAEQKAKQLLKEKQRQEALEKEREEIDGE